jgi:capsular polysaccharide biosynthesis protein
MRLADAPDVRHAGVPVEGNNNEVSPPSGTGPRERDHVLSDGPTEAPNRERWQEYPDTTGSDRPGFVASLLRYRIVIVAVTLFGALAGYAVSFMLPVRYQAKAVLIISDPGGPTVLGNTNPLPSSDRKVYLDKQADIMSSSAVLQRAVQLLGTGESVDHVRSEITVQPSDSLASVAIGATNADPAAAAAMANAVGTAYEQVTAERAAADAQQAIASLEKLRTQFQGELDASPTSPDGQLSARQQELSRQIADVQQREQDITTQAGVYASGVEYFEQAQAATSPSQPKPKLVALVGALLGLIASGAWAWWAAARHPRAEGRGDPARILEAPLLGEVRALPATTAADEPGAWLNLDPTVRDGYHLVVAFIEHELNGAGGKAIAVMGVQPGDSKTDTALRIADAASREHRKVLLIDADVAMPLLSMRAGTAPLPSERDGDERPLPRRLSAGAKMYVDRLVSTDSGMVLPVVPTADAAPSSASNGVVDVRHAVQSIGKLFDLVLIDAPALLASSNALGVARQADGVVLIVPHHVAFSDLRDARDRLAPVDTPLIGYVYVRPADVNIRTLWGRVTRPLRRASAKS